MQQTTDTNPSRQKYSGSDDVTTSTVHVSDDGEDAESAQCGIGWLRCRCLQVFAHPNVFVVLLGLLNMVYMTATGVYLSGVLSTIEKQFKLKSSESGVLASVNDIAALFGVLFVPYFGAKYHRPRIIGLASIVMGMGTMLTALPQFLFVNPDVLEVFDNSNNQSYSMKGTVSLKEDLLCNARETAPMECTTAEYEASGSQLPKAWPIVLGQLLAGFGSSAIAPLGIPYIDDAVDSALVPLYLAGMVLPLAISPIIGFSISSFCLSIYTDFYKMDAAEQGINLQDPQWRGAWWLGFVIHGIFMFLLAVPFFLFPRKMKKPKSYCCSTGSPDCCKRVKARRESGRGEAALMELHSSSKFFGKPAVIVKDFFATLRRLVTNATYMFAVMGFTFMIISFSGFGFFAAKYVQFQFGIGPVRAGMLLGFALMVGSVIGITLGGVITSRLAGNNTQGYATLTLILQIMSVLLFVILMFLGCPNDDIAGLTSQYRVDGAFSGKGSSAFHAPCNKDCACKTGVYSPVCGIDNVTYITACFAGCKTYEKTQNHTIVYKDCSCLSQNVSLNEPAPGSAAQGTCVSGCSALIPFLAMICITAVIVSIGHNPALMLRFRTVAIRDREVGIGLSSFISKILGFIPAPIIFGGAIESQCLFWQESCEKTGECMLYDRPGLRLLYLGMTVGTRFLAMLSLCLCVYCTIKNKSGQKAEKDDGIEEKQKKTEIIELS